LRNPVSVPVSMAKRFLRLLVSRASTKSYIIGSF
jgi:hypothetical protein